jgi:transcriptional regulator with XRE-family HTH domain
MEKGMTREQLSAVADVDVSYLGRVERGDNNVAFTTLQKIASGLGVSVSELTKKASL